MKTVSCWGLSGFVLVTWAVVDPAAGAGGLAIACVLIAAERRYRRRVLIGADAGSDGRVNNDVRRSLPDLGVARPALG